jgi:long-subunit fatty acid transport protein
MKRVAGSFAASLAIIFLNVSPLMAAATQIEGQGVRPISMGGAFIAVSDTPESVYYNPAGLTQIKGKMVPDMGMIFTYPVCEYTQASNNVRNKSFKPAMLPYTFITSDALKPVYLGFGMYVPFGREMDYNSYGQGGFGNAYGLYTRTDYSIVGALKLCDELKIGKFKLFDSLSLGGGGIASQCVIKQTIQAGGYGSGVYITDELEGWAYGWLVGGLCKVDDHWKIGLTYRSREIAEMSGEREMTGWDWARNSKVNFRYPATAGIGVAFSPDGRWTTSFDVDWNGWSTLHEVINRIDNAPTSVTHLDCYDSVDYRWGIEFKPDPTTSFRSGLMYIPAATPSRFVLPMQADYHRCYSISLGATKRIWKADLSLLYEYAWSDKWDVSDNVYGYNGRYDLRMQTFGIDCKFWF